MNQITRRLGLLGAATLAALSLGMQGSGSSPRLSGASPDKAEALAAFERLKKLEGRWEGQSTRGWTEESSIRAIAGGSVLVMQGAGAHPNEEMITMVHMDGDRLLLVHYCIAKNQPRLALSSIDEGGRLLTFTFLDGTNLPSRDKGHMDKVVMRLVDDAHFTEQWTWYQNGKEQWMERVENRRLDGASN